MSQPQRQMHKPAVRGRAEHVRSARVFQTRYCQGIIHFDAEISVRAFDLCMSEQKLDGPEIASPPVDKGSSCVQ